jgi:CheY-like chemotaxis protein
MDNILVVDRERTSGFLIKSILLGRNCNVSLSATLKDARAKLNSGLFDALVIDVGEPDAEMPFLAEAQSLLPGFPVVAVFREEPASGPFVALRKPIRVAPMSDALRQALGRSPASWNRHNLDVPAVVQFGAEFTECRVSVLSRHGLLVAPRHDFEAMRRFHEFFHSRLERDMDGRVEFPAGEEAFRARASYVEVSPDAHVRRVGLIFDADHEWFDRLVVAAAPESAEGEPPKAIP